MFLSLLHICASKLIFMKKTICALFVACFLFCSCNNDTTEIESPPFSVYPNPFVDVIGLRINPFSGTETITSLKVLDGTDKVLYESDSVMPGDNLQLDMSTQKKGTYYIEMATNSNTYNMAILKAQ